MIPVLGEEGASLLQREMTEYTLFLTQSLPVERVIYYSGGSLLLMQEWLGYHLVYQAQSILKTDLGHKMFLAFLESFQAGCSKVIIIGTDCPQLTPDILKTAFLVLDKCDLVIGPATDGGYYLIGMKYPISELFQGISWGSSQVLKETEIIAQEINLNYHLLPILSDVDLPEDLPVWEERLK